MRHLTAALAAALVLVLAGCAQAPNRSADAEAITAGLRSLPAVQSVDGRYAHGAVEGYSYNVDVRMAATASLADVLTTATTYYSGLARGDFRKHTSRLTVRLADDSVQVFGDDRHRTDPAVEVRRWYELAHAIPATITWAVGPAGSVRSISVQLADHDRLVEFTEQLGRQAADLADRQWIIQWRRIRLDLVGPRYPDRQVVAMLDRLVGDEQWSVVYRPGANPALAVSIWAPASGQLESAARTHLPVVRTLGAPVRYTVRADQTEPVEVLVGGCLRGGSELQQRLNAEFGSC